MFSSVGTGALLGAGLVLSALFNLYLLATARAHRSAGFAFAKRAVEAEAKVTQAEQKLKEVQQPFVINFKDEQVLKLADMVVDAVHTIEEAKGAVKQ